MTDVDALATRPARIGDYPALCGLWRAMDELHAQFLPSYFRRAPGPPKSLAEVDRILAAPDELLRIAESDAEIVGLVHALLYDTPPIPAMTPARRAHVDSLVVRPELRRRGIGKKLMAEVQSWAEAKGANEIVLTVWAGNLEAEAFYQGLGFSAVNRVLGKRLV